MTKNIAIILLLGWVIGSYLYSYSKLQWLFSSKKRVSNDYQLVDVELESLRNTWIELPDLSSIDDLMVNDCVELMFDKIKGASEGILGETLLFRIKYIEECFEYGYHYIGECVDEPKVLDFMKVGKSIVFESRHILSIYGEEE